MIFMFYKTLKQTSREVRGHELRPAEFIPASASTLRVSFHLGFTLEYSPHFYTVSSQIYLSLLWPPGPVRVLATPSTFAASLSVNLARTITRKTFAAHILVPTAKEVFTMPHAGFLFPAEAAEQRSADQ